MYVLKGIICDDAVIVGVVDTSPIERPGYGREVSSASEVGLVIGKTQFVSRLRKFGARQERHSRVARTHAFEREPFAFLKPSRETYPPEKVYTHPNDPALACSVVMALKRKRSTPSFASSSPLSYTSTTTQTASPLPWFYAQSKPVEAIYHKPTWSFPTYESEESTSSHHLGSRTRKRHRDDRPDEKRVHGMFRAIEKTTTRTNNSIADLYR